MHIRIFVRAREEMRIEEFPCENDYVLGQCTVASRELYSAPVTPVPEPMARDAPCHEAGEAQFTCAFLSALKRACVWTGGGRCFVYMWGMLRMYVLSAAGVCVGKSAERGELLNKGECARELEPQHAGGAAEEVGSSCMWACERGASCTCVGCFLFVGMENCTPYPQAPLLAPGVGVLTLPTRHAHCSHIISEERSHISVRIGCTET